VLNEFGLLDPDLPEYDTAVLDLVLRANRCGFDAVLANQAYAWRANPREASRHWSEAVVRIGSSYPELPPHIDAYLHGPQFEADRLLTGLIPEEDARQRILFDFSSFAPHHNGTFQAARRILASAAQQWQNRFRLVVMSTFEARRFHKLDEIDGIDLVGLEYDRPCAAAFRFGQPLAAEHLRRMSHAAPVNVWTMLDTIAWDCLYLRRLDLDDIWSCVLECSDAVIYISEAVQSQFHLRFKVRPGLPEQVICPSLNVQEYRAAEAKDSGSYLLVIGNAFAHKRTTETARALSTAFPNTEVVCIGGAGPGSPTLRFYESGKLPEPMIHELLSGASVVIFPSMHEGFGLPVLQGLAYGKPVIARSLPATRELSHRLGQPKNLLLYSSTPDLLTLLQKGIPKWQPETLSSGHDWDRAAEQIAELLEKCLNDVRYEEVLVPRIRYFSRKSLQDVPEVFPSRDLAQRVADLENSFSWRITRPLRTLADLALRLRAGALKTSQRVLGANQKRRDSNQ
jgi:glycosyltransferase involved in cell wall biosynthesis